MIPLKRFFEEAFLQWDHLINISLVVPPALKLGKHLSAANASYLQP